MGQEFEDARYYYCQGLEVGDPPQKQNESEKLCMEINRNSSNTATRCLVTAASLEIGSFHATFDEVRSMNCVRGKSRMFAIPNQKIVLVIYTKFHRAKSIRDPFSDKTSYPLFYVTLKHHHQVSQKNKTRPALRTWDLILFLTSLHFFFYV
jgi:hypothetical protein